MKSIISILFCIIMTVFHVTNASAECVDKFLCLSYQDKFEKALKETSEGDPLLIMDFASFNAREDIFNETQSLQQSVLDDFETFDRYRVTYQSENMPSDVKISDPIANDPGTSKNTKSEVIASSMSDELKSFYNDNNAMHIEDDVIADLKLRGIMEDEYRLASAENSTDAAFIDSMEFSYSKVMDNYFRGIAKTDVRGISSHFINKFLKEPCFSSAAMSNFRTRRLMLYRETIKEAAGLGYYAQVQSLDWEDLLADFESDIKKYSTGESADTNKLVRVNYLLRQFMNRIFAMFVQVRSTQMELYAVKKMFRDDIILTKNSMQYASELMEERNASSINN